MMHGVDAMYVHPPTTEGLIGGIERTVGNAFSSIKKQLTHFSVPHVSPDGVVQVAGAAMALHSLWKYIKGKVAAGAEVAEEAAPEVGTVVRGLGTVAAETAVVL
jgi:hypothetical protein